MSVYYLGYYQLGPEQPTFICWWSSPAGWACAVWFTNGESVVLFSGQFTLSLPLLSAPALGAGGWNFGLEYLAGGNTDGMLGPGFNHSHSYRLIEGESGAVRLLTADNSEQVFIRVSAGPPSRYSSVKNNTASTLTRTGEGTAADEFTLRTPDASVARYFGFHEGIPTPGRLKSFADRYGSGYTLSWFAVDGLSRLASFTDSYGRVVVYRYYGAEKNHQVREIEDFLGRKLNFQYDAEGRLTAIVTPSILKAAEGNTFPDGTAYVFEYDTVNPREERRNDIVRAWWPNEATPFIKESAREVDVEAVYNGTQPRYSVEYGQDPTDLDTWGKVTAETVGDPKSGVGGTYRFIYTTSDLPANGIDPADPIVKRTIVTDRNGNQQVYDFNAGNMPVRVEADATRKKNGLEAAQWVTWAKYNRHNQALEVVNPEGDRIEMEYEDGEIPGLEVYERRIGLPRRETVRPGPPHGLNEPSRPGSSGQTELTTRYFHDPLYAQATAVIEARGNPVDGDAYFTPQNGGETPTNADRSRYATFTSFDYQKDRLETVKADTALQARLGLDEAQIEALIGFVDAQMKDTEGGGGLPQGFDVGLGDINGDGTGDGKDGETPASMKLGSTVQIRHPRVRQLVPNAEEGTPWVWKEQDRVELFTHNERGQETTRTDAEGNLAVIARYPFSDPEGTGRPVEPGLGNRPYGFVSETYADTDPADVMTVVGQDGDLRDFISGKIPRVNTPGRYLGLKTRYGQYTVEAAGGGGTGSCASCGYDALGNPLAVTDARGFTTRTERNEMGEIYRTIGPEPYGFKTEIYYDANRNVIRRDTEDKQIRYDSDDPTDPRYGKFTPTGDALVANVPMKPGPGGTVRPGWFTNLYRFDLLDRLVEEDIDATGSVPSSLVTRHAYDPNGNRIRTVKPEGNAVEYDYDERNLRIATRMGHDPKTGQPGSVTVTVYDRNGNVLEEIGPAMRGTPATSRTVIIDDAFRSGKAMTHTGDWTRENIYDGFNRVIRSIDAVGGVIESAFDPDDRAIEIRSYGTAGGAPPTDRKGERNVPLSHTVSRYDEAGRTYETERAVFLNTGIAEGKPTHSLPSGRTVTHTGGGLAANSRENDHTATVELTAGETSYVLNRMVFDRLGRTTATAKDTTAIAKTDYDGADRAIVRTDALGNRTDTEYDNGGHAVFVTRTELAGPGLAPMTPEVFRTGMRYDALGRMVVTVEPGADGAFETTPGKEQGLVAVTGYDSRGHRTVEVAPKGNTAASKFDGAGRAIETVHHLRRDGQGENGPVAGSSFLPGGGASIVTRTSHDGNGRLIQLTDARGGITRYAYDTLDRKTSMTFHDGSVRQYGYNAASDTISIIDENGSRFVNRFDPLGRNLQREIQRAKDVVGTIEQIFEYDGLRQTSFARDSVPAENAGSLFQADIARHKDSLGRTVEEVQNSGVKQHLTNTAFHSEHIAAFTYPDGGHVEYNYDVLDRVSAAAADGSRIAAWRYLGPNRVAEVLLGNGLIATHLNNARTHAAVQGRAVPNPPWGDGASDRLGYDGSGRMIAKRFLSGGIDPETGAYKNTSPVAGFTTAFDASSNKPYERHLHAPTRSHLYQPYVEGSTPGDWQPGPGGIDSINRLRQYERGELSSEAGEGGAGGGAVIRPITLPGTDRFRNYDLDETGNWKKTAFIRAADEETQVTEVRQHAPTNQLTKYGARPVKYDHGDNADRREAGIAARGNGNITDDGLRLWTYDAFNRPVAVARKSDGKPIAAYRYDALNRRVRKTVMNGGITGDIPDGTTDYLYGPGTWQTMEERDVEGCSLLRQYVWGLYVDECMLFRVFQPISRGPGQALPAGEYYPLQDLLYRAVALTDRSGTIAEAYDTDAYGSTLAFVAPGNDGDWWSDDAVQSSCPAFNVIFCGYRFDAETKLYCVRHRYYDPLMGRWLQRDPMTYTGGINLYGYSEQRPVGFIDPSGTVVKSFDLSSCDSSDQQIILEADGEADLLLEELSTLLSSMTAEVVELYSDANATNLYNAFRQVMQMTVAEMRGTRGNYRARCRTTPPLNPTKGCGDPDTVAWVDIRRIRPIPVVILTLGILGSRRREINFCEPFFTNSQFERAINTCHPADDDACLYRPTFTHDCTRGGVVMHELLHMVKRYPDFSPPESFPWYPNSVWDAPIDAYWWELVSSFDSTPEDIISTYIVQRLWTNV